MLHYVTKKVKQILDELGSPQGIHARISGRAERDLPPPGDKTASFAEIFRAQGYEFS